LALSRGKSTKVYANHELTEEEKAEANAALIAAEKEQPIQNRKTAGDASETGLIKFLQSIRDI